MVYPRDSEVYEAMDIIEQLKSSIKVGMTVKVKAYRNACEGVSNKLEKLKVVGVYENFINVDMGLYIQSYAYSEIASICGGAK